MLAKLPRPTRLALAVSAALCSSQLLANPMGGQVVSGSASIQSSGNQTTINQSSNRAIINWQSFSIGNGERTHFNQPSASSAVLNRVLGGNPSELLGSLSANGKVFIINPNGVLVGAGATINTGAFVASTRDVSNPQFMAGGNLDFFGSTNASVVNLGTINATSGDVVLLAHTVSNQGTTTATSGTAALASGTELLYVPTGNERIVIKANALKDGGSVNQTGAIAAAQAELKAVGGNPYALAVNAGGTINVVSLDNVGGRIVLNAKSGTTQVSGNMVASQGDKGGEILATGQHVAISETANLNASGAHGGGRIAVGGGYQGKDNDLQNAQTSTVAKGANLLAAATDVGNGGQITVWADETTQYQGHANVRGGANGGDGGMIEVSGKRTLAYSGTVDMRAPRGHNGTLLLDPTDITINDDASSGSLMVAGNTSTLSATDIRNALLAGNVVISTSSAGGGSGDITVAAVGNSSAYFFDGTDNTLTLRADRDIAVNQSVRVFNFSPTSTNAGLTLEAGRNLSVNGGTTFLWSNNLTLVADAANAGAGGSTMRFADGVNLFGDNIRLFVPARGLLTMPSSVSVSSNADTFGKYYGDSGTAAAGIYYKSDRVVLTTVAISPQIRYWTISAQNEEFINASGDSTLIEWLKIYNAAKEKLKQNPGDETANLIAEKMQQEILKRLPDEDPLKAARLAAVNKYKDAELNGWIDEIARLELDIMKNGRSEKVIALIERMKRKVDLKLAALTLVNEIGAVQGEGFQNIVGFSSSNIIKDFNNMADPDYQKAREILTNVGRSERNRDYVFEGTDSDIRAFMFDQTMIRLTGMIQTIDAKMANQIAKNTDLKNLLKKIDDRRISNGYSSSTEKRVNLGMLWGGGGDNTEHEWYGELLGTIDKTSSDISTFLKQRVVISQMMERVSQLREVIINLTSSGGFVLPGTGDFIPPNLKQ